MPEKLEKRIAKLIARRVELQLLEGPYHCFSSEALARENRSDVDIAQQFYISLAKEVISAINSRKGK